MKRKMSRKRTGVDNESGTLEKRQRLMPRREKGQSLSDHGKCPESPKSEASTSEKLRYDSMELFAKMLGFFFTEFTYFVAKTVNFQIYFFSKQVL